MAARVPSVSTRLKIAAALLTAIVLGACSRAPPPAIGSWVPGTNYTVLAHPQPTGAPAGTVQVLEAFWYGCPHCYALDPYLEQWRMHKPAYVQFERVPVTWNDEDRSHARLFYALKTLDQLDQLHSKVFDAIHRQGDPLYVQGNYVATLESQENFVAANGLSGADFVHAYESAAVDTDLQQADALIRRYRIDSVPTLIVNGRYETDVGMAGGEQKLIQLIGDLAASEHAASEHRPAAH